MKIHAFLSLLLIALLSVPAQAQPPREGDRGGRGGDRGGRGGDRGGRGGDRGGFDPSQFLSRLDRNGNGMLDMDERDGPGSFVIGRLKRENPRFNADRPIPLKEISDAFTRMRGGGGDRGGRDNNDQAQASALEAGMLVPGFGVEAPPEPVPGFGATAEMFDVEVREEDRREAEERMRRYDRNRDGFLTPNELSSRWEGNPMDFDRNRDGKLSPAELAVRYARRREGNAQKAQPKRDSRDDRRRRDRDDDEPVDPYNGAKSFRNLGWPSENEELPELFKERDADGDGQVLMSEFASEWTQEKVEEFYALDRNGDGAITLAEVNAPRREDQDSQDDGRQSMTSTSQQSRSEDRGDSSRKDDEESRSQKYLDYSKRIISRYDTNEDGALQAAEWKKMLIDPSPADVNRDGRITADEYTDYLLKKGRR